MTRPPLDYVPEPDTISRIEADARALRAFRRGMILGPVCVGLGAVLAFITHAAFGDTISISGTMISLEPSDQPGIVAIVTMENVSLNGPDDNGDYTVAMPGMTVGVRFVWEVGAWGEDQITVTPPPGILCKPASCEIVAREGQTGSVALYEFVGM